MISAALAVLETEAQRNELTDIYVRNIKMFYSIAFSKLHDQYDAEDSVQEAFLAVANNPDVFFNIPEKKRASYINVIIRNISCRIWNKKQKIKEDHIISRNAAMDEQVSIEEKVLSDIFCGQILNFIDTLPEGTKAALYLRMHLGLKNADIARVLGISEEAAKKRVARAAANIKHYMEELKDE